ncbi:MFS transporter [Nocardioides dongxiaopingii]|uniref:MFS transporter n=1 Tax=Nocardioides dongxiaopingii TaxID=2576036 RepID=UPI0010C76CB5|nr:MFS transporter [Nocardioides dongxiaopingii]
MSTPVSTNLGTTTEADPRRWAGLAVLAASLLVVVMDMTILNVALPELTADLRPDAVAQLWIVDVYALVLAGLLVPVSALGDRWGRRRMLLAGFTVFGAASLLVLVADSPGEVIAVRALLGVGGAMIMPTTLSLIRTLFPDARERATALGIWGAMAAVGGAIGPIVGGALLEAFSWHAAFLFNVPVMVVAVVAGVLLLPESRSERPGRLDAAGVVASFGGMASFVYGVKHLGKEGLDPTTLATLGLGAALLTGFVLRCLRQDDPMLEVRLFRHRPFTAGVLAALTSSIAMVALLLLGSQWLQLVHGWSPLQTGAALLPMAVGGIVGSPLAPSLAERVGVRTVVAGGLAVAGVGLLLLFVLPQPLGYPSVAAALTLVGIGTASLAVGSAMIMGSAPADQAGSAAAIEESSFEIGGVLGVAVLGSLAAWTYRDGLPADATDLARESLAGALGTPAASAAVESFEHSFAVFGLAAGVLLIAVSALIWWLTPADLDLADVEH